MKLLDAYPVLALNAPGRPALIVIELEATAAGEVDVSVELLDRGALLTSSSAVRVVAAGRERFEVPVDVPEAEARGYQVRVVARPRVAARGRVNERVRENTGADDGRAASADAVATTALLAASHWRHAPRYGFLSRFGPEESGSPEGAERVADLAKFHVTIVQFYDWMYRHYQFQPPRDALGEPLDPFVDAMGREVSPSVVAERIADCHRHGMAALGYGAVYGPEPEFILARPDWLLYDAAGNSLNLIERFYITDLRPGGWREHILGEFESAVGEVGFDGIHMDQYGFPKLAYDAAGATVDLSVDFPSLIDEAAARLRAVRPDAGVIFNTVNDWPIDTVAPSDEEAVYIEVWPPNDSYSALLALIRRARDLSGKQVILSAYLRPFHQGGAAAEWALRYATAVIGAAGGHHLVLGEGTAVLREPYYPDHGQLSTEGVSIMRRYYNHSAAHTHYLHALDLRPVERTFVTGINHEFKLVGAPVAAVPTAGAVWLSIGQRAGQFVINLVNLASLTDDSWDAPQLAAERLDDLVLECGAFMRVARATWASPDSDDGATVPLTPVAVAGGGCRIALPPLQVWGTLVLDYR